MCRLGRVERWRKLLLPGIFPYLITGFVTASGGALASATSGTITAEAPATVTEVITPQCIQGIASGSSTAEPIENRKRMNPTGVTSFSAFCTSLNVAP